MIRMLIKAVSEFLRWKVIEGNGRGRSTDGQGEVVKRQGRAGRDSGDRSWFRSLKRPRRVAVASIMVMYLDCVWSAIRTWRDSV